MRFFRRLLAALAIAVVAVFFIAYLSLQASLPVLDGRSEAAVTGPITIERDSLGVPLIRSAERGDIAWAIHEPGSGVLLARRAVEMVVREAVSAGVRYIADAVPTFARTSPEASDGAAIRIDRCRLPVVTTRSGETM